MQRTLIVVGAMLCGACQTYTAASLDTLRPGNDVRFTLADSGTQRMISVVGPRAAALTGTLVERDSLGFQLRTREVTRTDGVTDLLHNELIRVPADAVATVQLRQLDKVRSALVAGALIAGAALIAHQGSGDNVLVNPNAPQSSPQ